MDLKLLNECNDAQLAELWHKAHETLDEMEKLWKEHQPVVTAKAVIEEIKRIATERLENAGASSIVTPFGTIHTVSKTTARIMDPEVFRLHVIQRQAWDMIDWKANMTSCRAEVEAGKPVPGVELSTFRRLSITAPKAPMKRLHDDGE